MRSTFLGILPAFASLLLATPAVADDELSPIDVCTSFSLIAKDVMTARQIDRPMSETLPFAIDRIKKWADEVRMDMDAKDTEKWAAEMVMVAYDSPSYGNPRDSGNSQDEISDFENKHFEQCYKELTSD